MDFPLRCVSCFPFFVDPPANHSHVTPKWRPKKMHISTVSSTRLPGREQLILQSTKIGDFLPQNLHFLVGDDSPSKVLQDELLLRGCLALCILQVGRIQAFVAYWVEGWRGAVLNFLERWVRSVKVQETYPSRLCTWNPTFVLPLKSKLQNHCKNHQERKQAVFPWFFVIFPNFTSDTCEL